MNISKSDAIAIIGGGAFGLSTALELSRKGYTNITVFEKDDEIPSRWSAGNDLNKIMRAEYEDDFYTDLAVVCSCLNADESYEGLIVRAMTDTPKGSHPRLANAPLRALLPPGRLSQCCFWGCIPKSSGNAAPVPGSCREAPGDEAFLSSYFGPSRRT